MHVEDARDEAVLADDAPVPPKVPATLEAYRTQLNHRRSLFEPSAEAQSTSAGYAITPVGAAPHAARIHAMALVQDATVLLTGGSDGYVRWYDLEASMNGRNMLTQNLRSTFVEGVSKGGVLSTWWGHAHLAPGEPLNKPDAPLSPVHSLACERNALWGMSGGEAGNINMFGLRHDPGATWHVFRKHTSTVSALALSDNQTELISGGWDRGVYVRCRTHTAMGFAYWAGGALIRWACRPDLKHCVPAVACAQRTPGDTRRRRRARDDGRT